MAFEVVKDKQGFFRVKNTSTGKIGRDRFVSKANADIQKRNRDRFVRLIQTKAGGGVPMKNSGKKKGKNGKYKK
jgi:hypothetical protein